MPDELSEAMRQVESYVAGVEAAVHKFIDVIPHLTTQHIAQVAKTKLHGTLDDYLGSLNAKVEDYVLTVEIDPGNWIANAVEGGVGAFDLRKTLLSSPKAKTSKAGHKYMVIPMGKDKNNPGGTDKSRDFQKRIRDVLLKPKLEISKIKMGAGGTVIETQKIINDDPVLQGFYRTRTFDNAAELFSGTKKPTWNHILFRVITDNPDSEASWWHPGITAAKILPETERWLDREAKGILEGFLEAELKARNLTK